jgi:outer membrane murein-binding lipoprotein Lpp
MKKWQAWLLIIGAVIVVFVLVEKGIIRWQPLTVLVAAILGPLKFLGGLFGGSKEDEIRERHRQLRAKEAAFQERLEADVQQREDSIERLQADVEQVDAELERLARRREALAGEISAASDEEALERGRRAFG